MRDVVSRADVYRVARIYPAGELSVSKAVVNSASKVPEPTYGRRSTAGVSRNGARVIRRSVMARAQTGAQFVLITLSSQEIRSDAEMQHHLEKLLAWGRKYLGPWFDWYIWVAELQQRGVLHYHLLLPKRIPKALYRRFRKLWCETYGMGPGAFDIRQMRSSKGTAKYLAKYVVKRPPEGQKRVSRHNGKEYEREVFAGNAYALSQAARWGTAPVIELAGLAGSFPGLDGWHGVSRFFDSAEEAEAMLAHVLAMDQVPLTAQWLLD